MRQNLKVWSPNLCSISDGAEIGDDVIIHPFVCIYDDVSIGDDCKIQSGVFIPNGTKIGHNVFVGPHTVFTNDKYPPSYHTGWNPVIVKDFASIGANCTILPGVTIGYHAVIGAGSVLTKDVPDGETWVGNPARPIKE